jgi:nucleoside 2-deoxyribosyltransferase
MSQERDAFVLIPFTPDFDAIYERAIKPICEEAGYEVNKADTTDTQGNILRDIIEGIDSADILVVDLTNSNPNVFYEAGIADGLGVPTVLITQDIESVPFDLDKYNMIKYENDAAGIGKLEEELENAVGKHSEGEMKFGSPVTDFTEVDIRNLDINSIKSDVEDDNGEATNNQSSDGQKGIMDYAEDAENARRNLEHSVEEIVARTNEFEGKLLEHTNRINAIDQSEGEVSASRANRLFRGPAQDMQDYGESISEDTETIERSIDTMMKAEEEIIENSALHDDDQRKELMERQDELQLFRAEMDTVVSQLEDLHFEVTEIKGINRSLNRGVQKVTTPLSHLINTLTGADARAERMEQRIEQKLTESK